MGGIRCWLAGVLGVAYFLAFCCDTVSSAVSDSDLNNPFDQQCSWLFRSNPDDCRTYFQCLHGRSVMRRCPRALHWNPHGHFCESQVKSVCKAGKKKGAGSNTVLEAYNNTKEYLLRGKYREPCPENSFIPYPYDCTKFIQCTSNNGKVVRDCPGGLYFDSKTQVCNWPQLVECNSTGTTESPQTTLSPMETTVASATTPRPFTSTSTALPTTTSTAQPTTNWWTTSTWPTTRPTTTTTTTMRPDTSPTKYPILIPQSDKKIVCYYTNWSVYRPGVGKFEPSDIDPSKCTHIIYAFACLNGKNYKLEPCDTWIDTPEGKNHYGQVTKLKELGVTVTVAVGGWNDSGYSKWNQMLKDPVKMDTFIRSAAEFIKKYNFDGVDLDYEYPVCPQANCNYDSIFEKQGFVSLIRGLRQVCGPQAILTAAVSCNENIIKEAYDVPTMSKYLNFINLMAYDFHGAWEPKTGINAPFQLLPPDEHHLNADHAVKVFLALGAPASKLVLGIPTYGQSYTVSEPVRDHDIGAKSMGPGAAGEWTKQKGMLAYYEICDQTWTKTVHDKDQRVGPYRYSITDGTWVSYDDDSIIQTKASFIKDNGLAGGMVWAMDFDDFSNHCGEGRYPLLSSLNKHLRGPPSNPQPVLRNKKKAVSSSRGKTSVTSTKRTGSSSSNNRISRSNAPKTNSASGSKRQTKTRRNA